jgi:ATP-dependent protease HslVU (ClpYQ) peptidase subunit
MTTITYRDGIIAADTLVYDSGVLTGQIKKVVKANNGDSDVYIAGSGTIIAINYFISNFPKILSFDFEIPEAFTKLESDFSLFIIDKIGQISLVEGYQNIFTIKTPFIAIGSGGKIALGAMGFGASAEEAVQVAAKFDSYTGSIVETYNIKDL